MNTTARNATAIIIVAALILGPLLVVLNIIKFQAGPPGLRSLARSEPQPDARAAAFDAGLTGADPGRRWE